MLQEPIVTETNLRGLAFQAQREHIFQEFLDVPGITEAHNFRISPENLEVSREQVEELEEIASTHEGFVEGISRLMALSMINDKLRRTSPLFRSIRLLLGIEADFTQNCMQTKDKKDTDRDVEAEIQALSSNRSNRHPFCRFDIVIDPLSGHCLYR